MNKVLLSGRLTRDFELKITSSNVKFAQNSIAVSREFADKEGNYQTDFFNFTLFDKVAENYAVKHLKKGDLVEIEATLQNNNREVDGKMQYNNELQGVKIKKIFIGNKDSQENQGKDDKGSNNSYRSSKVVDPEDLPF